MPSLTDTATAARRETPGILLEPGFLIHPPGGIGLIWSPKSACTTALLWYLAHLGLLEDAAAFSHWPHNYRMKVLPELEIYRQWLVECDPDRLRWVRVIRDPFLRAVSGYRHALRYGFENGKIGEFLGLPVAERGFSFSELLAYLAQVDIASCDYHLARQWHSGEATVTTARVINADREPLLEALCDFADPGESMRPLLSAEASRIADLHHARRVRWAVDCSDVVFQSSSTGGEWPDYDAFLNPATRSRIELIYREDFARFRRHL